MASYKTLHNTSRDFFKNVNLPLESVLGILVTAPKRPTLASSRHAARLPQGVRKLCFTGSRGRLKVMEIYCWASDSGFLLYALRSSQGEGMSGNNLVTLVSMQGSIPTFRWDWQVRGILSGIVFEGRVLGKSDQS